MESHERPSVHCSVIYSSRALEAAQVPTSSWAGEQAVVHLHTEHYLAVKKKEIVATAWMGLESVMLSEISQPENANTI